MCIFYVLVFYLLPASYKIILNGTKRNVKISLGLTTISPVALCVCCGKVLKEMATYALVRGFDPLNKHYQFTRSILFLSVSTTKN